MDSTVKVFRALALGGVVAAVGTSIGFAQHLENKIGTELVGTPGEDYKSRLGMMIKNPAETTALYSIEIFENTKSKVSEVYLGKMVGRKGKQAQWKVMDALIIPRLKSAEEIAWLCKPVKIGGQPAYPPSFTFGVATFPGERNAASAKTLRHVWRINWNSHRFENVPESAAICRKQQPID